MTVNVNNGGEPVSQSVSPSRAVYGSYKDPIEVRAVLAVLLIEDGVCGSIKAAAAALCVNPFYLRLVRHLSDDDRLRLANRELTLAEVARDYRKRLAERRAQREAQEQAERDELQREAEAAHELHVEWEAEQERVKRFASGGNVPGLSDDVVENIVREVGVDRIWKAVDRITAPELPFAEAAE